MVNNRKLLLCVITFTLLFVLIFSPVSQGKEEIFPLAKLKPGMTGEGYTVLKGTKIDKFNVKVLEILNGGFGDEKLILVKLSGKNLEEAGGLSAGMSGSPVYIKDRLIGAISYGFSNADPMLAMVTPIESMFKLLTNYYSVSQPIQSQNGLTLVPVATPIVFSGMGERGYELMSHSFKDNVLLKPVYSPGTGKKNEVLAKDIIHPGSAIAVQMVSGDYQASAIGTVTWTDGTRFLAFGHPFTNKGKVDFQVYHAQILQTVKSSVMSFKMGTPLEPVGRIIQDRSAGIVGEFGKSPQMIEVSVNVRDLDRNTYQRNQFKVINHELFYRDLIVAGTTAAIDQAIDRVGAGTAKVSLIVETGDNQINRQNMFYGKDIAINCLEDLRQVLDLLVSNEFYEVDLKKISLAIEVTNSQETARVIKLDTKTKKVKPGDTLEISALLHSFRGKNFTKVFTVKLPENLQLGKLIFSAHNSTSSTLDEKDSDNKKETEKVDYKNIESLDGLIGKYLEVPKNNELIIEYYPLVESEKEDIGSVESIKLRSETPYVILGDCQLEVEVGNL